MPLQIGLEAWILDIVDAVLSNRHVEDSRVEIKSSWPTESYKTARQLAAQANAAHGARILWIIGLDEKGQVLVGAERQEFENWWPAIESCFDEIFPEQLEILAVPVKSVNVVGLLFETGRAPFVVRLALA